MFEFMYAKKIGKDEVENLAKEIAKDYYISFDVLPNGRMEIFVGAKREDVKERINE